MQAVQGANWQRSGGRGAAPQRIKRPDDKPPRVKTTDELVGRREAQRAELERRRRSKRQTKGA